MKNIILSILFLIISHSSYSQLNFGLRSGLNISTTKGIITYPKNRLGLYAGALAKISFKNKFLFQTELLYSSKGYKYLDLSTKKNASMRFNYLNLPILFGYEIDDKTKVIAGVDFGYLASAINFINEERINTSASFPTKIDAGVCVGVNYNIYKLFGAEIRYNFGFKNIYQTDGFGVRRNEANGGNRVFQIGCYYLFTRTKS